MKNLFFFYILILLTGCGSSEENTIVLNEKSTKGIFTLTETKIKIPQADFDSAIFVNEIGYKQIDRKKFDDKNQGRVIKEYEAIVLENSYIRLTLLPKLGKPYSFVYKITGNEEFFIPKIAHLHYSPNKLGWWFMLGGVEYNMPDEEHGDTWAADWQWEIKENSETKKTVRLKVKELRFGLEEVIDISISPDKAYYTADFDIHNPTDSTIHFQHWVNPMWTPGKTGELTPNTEFIIPTKEVYATERDFNKWMLDYHPEGKRLQPYEDNPMRFLKNWKYYGDLLAVKLEQGYYSAFSHEQDEGIVRVFPLEKTPGCNIWTWGANPEPSFRELYSGDSTHAGYVEMWGGITNGFKEYYPLKPGERIGWKEYMYPYHGIKGLHYANEDIAITFFRENDSDYTIGICPAGDITDYSIQVSDPENKNIITRIKLESFYPQKKAFSHTFKYEPGKETELELVKNGATVIKLNPKLKKA